MIRAQHAALGLVTVLSACLRFYRLDAGLPIDDEFYQFFEALRPGSLAQFLALIRENPHHVLLDLSSTYLVAKVGSGPGWLRLPSAAAGVAAVPLLWLLTRRAGEKIALGASLLLAVSLIHVDWSRRADFYAALTVLSIALSWAFFRLLDDPRRWRGYSLIGAIFLLTHPYAVLFAPFHFAFAALFAVKSARGGAAAALLKAWLWAGVCFAPWFFYSTFRLADTAIFGNVADHVNLTRSAFVVLTPLFLGAAAEVGPDRAWGMNLASVYSGALLALYSISLTARIKKTSPALFRYAHLLCAYGFVCVFGLDTLYRYYYSHHQLLWLLPFYLLAAADGALILVGSIRRPGLAAFVSASTAAAALAASLTICSRALSFQFAMGERNAEICRFVLNNARPGDIFIFDSNKLMFNVLYFLDRGAFSSSGELRLLSGYLDFVPPSEGVQIRAAGLHRVELSGHRSDDESPPRNAWRFTGNLFEMKVFQPIRAKP